MTAHHDHKRTYLTVWGLLLLLTVMTVWVAYHDWGTWNIFIAMLVATVKASLVVLFFMHLKYDNRVNQVVFVSAFFFLATFVGLTASDLFFRPQDQPAWVAPSVTDGGVAAADVAKWRMSTPALVAEGKALHAAQCATCHGATGGGDGPAAGAMNPRPRNFTTAEGWKFGREPSRIFTTITDGSPGTGMAPFGALPVKDRWALAHFVRTLAPNAPDDTPEMIAALTAGKGNDSAEARPKAHLPVALAMQLAAEPEVTHAVRGSQRAAVDGAGAQLYRAHCARCHGGAGEGGVKVTAFGVNPYVHLTTKPLVGARGAWTTDPARFIKLVSEGMPGSGKPGIAHFSSAEWTAIYAYVKGLIQ